MRTPIVTILLMIANIAVYFLVQPLEINAGTDFTFATAAIPEEITTGEPLSEIEICQLLAPSTTCLLYTSPSPRDS